ncbi:hypothetical protein NC651_014380 [Populus alba x Populus x berolinensis]|nr:hypothetical protein NC651_014380 [Populus alba x Populus x berolinensis]
MKPQQLQNTKTILYWVPGSCKERLVPIACKWMDVCCAVGLGYHSEPNPKRLSGYYISNS